MYAVNAKGDVCRQLSTLCAQRLETDAVRIDVREFLTVRPQLIIVVSLGAGINL